MKKVEDYYFTNYHITFKVGATQYVCDGKHYYPSKKQHINKEYHQVIVDDIAGQIIDNYKKEHKITGKTSPVSIKITLDFVG